ncbi:hypothetical protein [Chitinibacter sp. S2-10]|uniref:hypothetical protein n=1 Tax=Chitinibacter sp. S2-10 TaxID=3373597 RepID=UPI003977D3A9
MTPAEFDEMLLELKQSLPLEKNLELITQAIVKAQQMAYPLGQAQALVCRGEYLLTTGEQPSVARKDFRDAALIARQLKNWKLLAQVLHWQAQSQLMQGEYLRALDIWLQALQVAIEAEDSRAFIQGYAGIAQVCLVFKQLDISQEYQRRALALAENLDDILLQVECLLAVIASCYQQQQFDEMQLLLERLHRKLQIKPQLEAQAEFHIYTGLIYLDRDQLDMAYEHLQLAQVLAHQFGGLWCRAYSALILGRIYHRQNKLEAARTMLEQCLVLAENIRGFSLTQEAHELLETLCAQQGDYAGALMHLECIHTQQLSLLQKQAERKLTRMFHKQLNQLEMSLRLELGHFRYS